MTERGGVTRDPYRAPGEAGRAGPRDPEGQLIAARRLRPLVEPLHGADGHLYLLQGEAGGDCVIRDPAPEVRAAVDALREGAVVADELVAALEAMDLLEPEPAGPPLDPVDAVRFDRQLLYLRQVGTGAELQRRLRSASVVVLGCGGLGSWAAWSLATIGVGRLVLVDPDTVDATNLNRQLLFEAADVGRSKAALAARRLAAFDPRLEVTALEQRIEGPGDVARLAEGASLVVACADTPAYDIARWIDAGCAAAGAPHVSAGQIPPTIRVGPFVQPGATPCLRCLEAQLRRGNPLAAELEAMRKADPRPAATLGPACGVIGSLIALDALHWLTGLARPATWGTVLTMDVRTLVTERTPVVRAGDCCVSRG